MQVLMGEEQAILDFCKEIEQAVNGKVCVEGHGQNVMGLKFTLLYVKKQGCNLAEKGHIDLHLIVFFF